MIVYNIKSSAQINSFTRSRAVRRRRHTRIRTIKKLTKDNKLFLRALGFKL